MKKSYTPTLASAILPTSNRAPQHQWTQGEAANKWISPTFNYSLAKLELLVLKQKHQWPVGGKKDFTKDPLGSLQALIDFAIRHRDAGKQTMNVSAIKYLQTNSVVFP